MFPWVIIKGPLAVAMGNFRWFSPKVWLKMCLVIVLCSDIVASISPWSPLYKIGGSIVGNLLPPTR